MAISFYCSLRVFKPAYSEPAVPKPGNREGCGRNSIGHKHTLGCVAGLTVVLICMAAAGLVVIVVRGTSD